MFMGDIVSLGFGIVVVVGGLIGYLKKKSFPSLFAGTASGAAIIYAAQLYSTNPRLSNQIVLAVSGVLTIAMGLRFKNSGKVMPAGIVAALSLVMGIRAFLAL